MFVARTRVNGCIYRLTELAGRGWLLAGSSGGFCLRDDLDVAGRSSCSCSDPASLGVAHAAP
eukprot:965837-Alexandrium_andersonii.AAC.1